MDVSESQDNQENPKSPVHQPFPVKNRFKGFIVHAWLFRGSLRLTGRLVSGESFAIIIKRPGKLWFKPHGGEVISYAADLARETDRNRKTEWTGYYGGALQLVPSAGPDRLPSGLNPVDEYLLSRGIRGEVEISGIPGPGRRVTWVFVDPDITSPDSVPLQRESKRSDNPVTVELQEIPIANPTANPSSQGIEPNTNQRVIPSLVWAALDIETDPQNHIIAISLVQGRKQIVFFWGSKIEDPEVQSFDNEKDMLLAFSKTLRDWDPDVLTGWNVGDFDFVILSQRYSYFKIPFDGGRAEGEEVQVRKTPSGLTRVIVPGRQVVDGMRIVRGSGQRYDDQRLETVAQEVLGRGKLVEQSGEEKLAELARLRIEDPLTFCKYCMEDSRLVLDILEKTGLDVLTVARAGLTGISLDLAWTSIPAFEQIYALELLARRIIPPVRDRDVQVSGAAGGTVLDPTPGYFHNVLVFDFRSLYPSIMRTFNIDPLVYHRTPQRETSDVQEELPAGLRSTQWSDDGPQAHSEKPATIEPRYPNSPESPILTAPNGACFSKNQGILPVLLEQYFEARKKALDSGDETGAYVYKILMNSFYGVLGSGGCVYGRSELAGAITGFGRMCLHFARDFFQRRGMTVLYGDTDSVFIYAKGREQLADAKDLATELNSQLSRQIKDVYGLTSTIQIRFDTFYSRFLLPKLRTTGPVGSPGETELTIRGRAKGYAGLDGNSGKLEIKGMEAARSDYTTLAQEFQTKLLGILFRDGEIWEIEEYIRGIIQDLFAGKLDEKLVYRKVLRRPARDYTANVSPQVRAARILGWTYQRGRISYLMTLAGPEPLGHTSAGIDYRHYIEHQLRPIWISIAEAADLGDRLVNPATWAELLGRRTLMSMNPLDDQLELGL